MANIQAPFGFYGVSGTGSAPTYEQVTARIAAANTHSFFSGDPVTQLSTGYIDDIAAGTSVLAGIFVGCKYLSTAFGRVVWSSTYPGSGASGDIEAYIINDPNAQFLAQAGGSTTAIGIADIGATVKFGLGTGSTLTGRSGAFVDQTTIGPNTATDPFKIINVVTSPPGANGTDLTTGYNYVIVGFNNVSTKTLSGV